MTLFHSDRQVANKPTGAVIVALWVVLASCAHAPQVQPQVPEGPVPTWPLPPAAPQVRWQGAWPARQPVQVEAAWWRRALDAVFGTELAQPERPVAPERPFGVAATETGFAVADPDGRQVLSVAWPSGQTTAIACADQPWQMPLALAVSEAGELFVADGGAGAVVVVAADGRCRTLGEQTLERPAAIALAGDRLYVADPPLHRVIVYSLAGAELFRMGGRGEGDAQLNFPTGVAVGADGSVFVVDSMNFRVARYSDRGEWLGSFGGEGDGGGRFHRPKSVAIGPDGRIFVSDATLDVVVVFDSATAFALALGGSGSSPGSLALPAGVAVRGSRLYVADSGNRRVQVFELLGGVP
ncbi:MAG TPA: hypothetical protein VGK67_19180 [Myxococcales bacterium]|jgi:hypothetical protein